jgi:hypothetical protein
MQVSESIWYQRHRETEPSYNLDMDLLDHFRWRATRPGDSIANGFVEGKQNLISAPLANCFSNRLGIAFLLVVGSFMLFIGKSKIESIPNCGLSKGCSVLGNVTNLRILGGISSNSPNLTSQALSSFEMRYQGCTNYHENTSSDGAILLPEPASLDGFSIHFNPSCFRQTISFHIVVSSDNWKTIETIGSSRMIWANNGIRMSDTPIPCPERFSFHYAPPWHLLMSSGSAAEAFLLAAGLLVTSLAASISLPWANRLFIVMLSLAASLNFVSAVGAALEPGARYLVLPCSMAIGYAAFAALTVLAPRRFPEAALALGLYATAATVLDSCAAAGDCAALIRGPPIVGPALCLAAALLEWARCRHVAAVARHALLQQRRAEHAWEATLAAPDGPAALRRLQSLFRSGPLALLVECPCQQLNRQRAATGSGSDSEYCPSESDPAALRGRTESVRRGPVPETVPCTADPARPVGRLDQLYSQARGERERGREGPQGPSISASCWPSKAARSLWSGARAAVRRQTRTHGDTDPGLATPVRIPCAQRRMFQVVQGFSPLTESSQYGTESCCTHRHLQWPGHGRLGSGPEKTPVIRQRIARAPGHASAGRESEWGRMNRPGGAFAATATAAAGGRGARRHDYYSWKGSAAAPSLPAARPAPAHRRGLRGRA